MKNAPPKVPWVFVNTLLVSSVGSYWVVLQSYNEVEVTKPNYVSLPEYKNDP